MTKIGIYDLIITLCRLYIFPLKEVGQTICCKKPPWKDTHGLGANGQKTEMKPKAKNN